MKVALLTTHVPLSQVSRLITSQKFEETLKTIHRDLIQRFKINDPVIFVAGLNPHAGENGVLGLEEIDILMPVINKLKLEGMLIEGPFPADTLFTEKYIQKAIWQRRAKQQGNNAAILYSRGIIQPWLGDKHQWLQKSII